MRAEETKFDRLKRRHPQLDCLLKTAYYLAKKGISFRSFEDIVRLQRENGLDMGTTNFSQKAVKNMIVVISDVIRRRLVKIIETKDLHFSLLADESISIYMKANNY